MWQVQQRHTFYTSGMHTISCYNKCLKYQDDVEKEQPVTPSQCTVTYPILKSCLLFVGIVTYFLIYHHIYTDVFQPILRRFCQPNAIYCHILSELCSLQVT